MNNREVVDQTQPDGVSRNGTNSSNSTSQLPAAQPNDIYTDPALAQGASSDPIYLFLSEHWKQVLYAAIAIVALTYFVTSFRQAQEDNLSTSADYFAVVEESYQALESAEREYQAALLKEASEKKPADGTSADAKGKENGKDAKDAKAGKDSAPDNPKEVLASDGLKAKRDTLRESFNHALADATNQAEPYRSVRALYLARLARLENDQQSLKAKINETSHWKEVKDTASFERLNSELLALAVARGLLDIEDQKVEGKKILASLAESAVFVAVPAAVAFSDVAFDDNDRAAALKSLESLLARHPEQGELLKDPIARLKAQKAEQQAAPSVK